MEKKAMDNQQRTQINQSIQKLTDMFTLDRKIQHAKSVSNRQVYGLSLVEIMKRHLDAKKYEEDQRSELTMRFQRTMKRLSVLRSFAKMVGMEFDIDQLDIASLTRRSKSRNSKVNNVLPDHQQELIQKQNYITNML